MTAIPAAVPGRRPLLGILGGMGPRAHVALELFLLEAAETVLGARVDQAYPAWVLVSMPTTPDRTRALRDGGESPRPMLRRGLSRLAAAGAEFALAACVTSHAFLDEPPEGGWPLPVLSLPRLTARAAAAAGLLRPGILATTGALAAALFQRAMAARGLSVLTPPDLPGGAACQEEDVMAAIYGRVDAAGRRRGGLKSEGATPEAAERLRRAAGRLADAGADGLILGCTEIPLVAEALRGLGLPLLDPLRCAAEAAVRYGAGLPVVVGGDPDEWGAYFL